MVDTTRADDPTDEVTDLLQTLIRNQCVNDGTEESGQEHRNVDTLTGYLGDAGLESETYEIRPGRTSLVTRIEGRNPDAPTLLLMGHTDVVPVSPEGWERDPFGAELVDGMIWGRGAVDMLNMTASMAVAMKHLARSGFTPEGTLAYLAVADEESRGVFGADHLVENEYDAVAADYVITETGGFRFPTPEGPRLPVLVGEKGTFWCTLRVRGTPGHGSQPFRTDNALVTAARVVQRLADYEPSARVLDVWREFVGSIGLSDDVAALLVDPDRLSDDDTLPIGIARIAHSSMHTTVAPTVIHGGTKTNVIPDQVDLRLDIRTLPGDNEPEVRAMLDDALGDLAGAVEMIDYHPDPATESPMDTPLWHHLEKVTRAMVADSALVPMLMIGATDARFFRRAGSVGYGFSLFSERLEYADYATMFHGHNEKVDQESLRLSTELWQVVAREVLG
ncbi:MAG: M20/M25/M40 family metallo-hydrolase [Acidimicrobiia bacterium]|nr:M20/M25/M40 family metallo-hydrolase [Acidimicrobiia bacterium]